MSKKPRVLVTGGAGFIGNHLVESLLKDGMSVSVIDDLSTGSWDNISRFKDDPDFSIAIADIRDPIVLDRLASQADIIFHLAAAVGVELIIDQPVRTIETNIMGSEAVLKVAARYKCRILMVSTSEVYGKGMKVPYKEVDDVVLGATDKSRWSYAATKMVDEFLTLAYCHEYGLPATVCRLFNTVGPGQSGQYGMVLPRFVSQALAGKPITIYGDGTQTRCFCDVSDVVKALKGLISTPDSIGKVYNVGNTEEVSIRGLAERVKKLLKSRSQIRSIPYSEAYQPGFEDMMRRIPDTSRIQKLLGWKPTIKLDRIIARVAEYEKKARKA